MKHCTLSPRAGGIDALAQVTLFESIRTAIPHFWRCQPQGAWTKPRAEAREAAWYDEHYRKIIAASEKSAVPTFPRSLKTFGPWYYFLAPELCSVLKPADKVLELGCGQGHILRHLVGEKIVHEENIHGLDQSQAAVDQVKEFLPDANITTGDIYQLEHPDGSFP